MHLNARAARASAWARCNLRRESDRPGWTPSSRICALCLDEQKSPKRLVGLEVAASGTLNIPRSDRSRGAPAIKQSLHSRFPAGNPRRRKVSQKSGNQAAGQSAIAFWFLFCNFSAAVSPAYSGFLAARLRKEDMACCPLLTQSFSHERIRMASSWAEIEWPEGSLFGGTQR